MFEFLAQVAPLVLAEGCLKIMGFVFLGGFVVVLKGVWIDVGFEVGA